MWDIEICRWNRSPGLFKINTPSCDISESRPGVFIMARKLIRYWITDLYPALP